MQPLKIFQQTSYFKYFCNPSHCMIFNLLQINSALLDFSKWGTYLPDNYKVKLVKDRYFDIEQTEKLLTTMKIIENK